MTKIETTLGAIADLVGGELEGDPDTRITGISGIREARKGDITFLANEKYESLLQTTRASACVVSRKAKSAPIPIIRVKNPDVAFTTIVNELAPHPPAHPPGVHRAAMVGDGVTLGKDVAIEAYAVIADGAVVGDRTVVMSLAYVGHEAVLGKDCVIYPNVTIRERVRIGDRVIIHAGSVDRKSVV